jgi:hypothetical protein
MNHSEELVGDAGDRDVRDLDLLLPEEVEQEIERTGEALQLDDESAGGIGRRARIPPRIEG